jgi:ribosome biogenesis GTPase A
VRRMHCQWCSHYVWQVLSRVDVVVEVRDARIPASTTHPMVDEWLRNRNTRRIVALNKVDMAPRYVYSAL